LNQLLAALWQEGTPVSRTLYGENSQSDAVSRLLVICGILSLLNNWVLREILLSEHEDLDMVEFITKVEIWLKLAHEKK
jgi:hypothetical protein